MSLFSFCTFCRLLCLQCIFGTCFLTMHYNFKFTFIFETKLSSAFFLFIAIMHHTFSHYLCRITFFYFPFIVLLCYEFIFSIHQILLYLLCAFFFCTHMAVRYEFYLCPISLFLFIFKYQWTMVVCGIAAIVVSIIAVVRYYIDSLTKHHLIGVKGVQPLSHERGIAAVPYKATHANYHTHIKQTHMYIHSIACLRNSLLIYFSMFIFSCFLRRFRHLVTFMTAGGKV